jgi:putative heme-binding domain-containing protein
MPPSQAPDTELWAIVAYLRNINAAKPEESSGSVANGARILAANCASCHRVNNVGGAPRPDLRGSPRVKSNQSSRELFATRAARSQAGMKRSPLVTRDGQQIRGTQSEDTFSIQIMDTNERLQGVLKANLREIIRDEKSLMPDFGPDRLSDRDLNDLLAFLGTLRTRAPANQNAGPVNQR